MNGGIRAVILCLEELLALREFKLIDLVEGFLVYMQAIGKAASFSITLLRSTTPHKYLITTPLYTPSLPSAE